MTTSPTGSTSSPTSTAALRLRLDPVGRTGPLDGAWWPHSRDLAVEAARLVDDFPDEVGRVSRLVFSSPDWDAPADGARERRIRTHRGTVKLGTFPRDDTHVMVVTLSSHERLHVLVVPPDTDPARAEAILELAATATNGDTAGTLLGLQPS
jgi:hypothetical protein